MTVKLIGCSNPGWSFTNERLYQLYLLKGCLIKLEGMTYSYKEFQEKCEDICTGLDGSKIRMFFPFLKKSNIINNHENFLTDDLLTEEGKVFFDFLSIYFTLDTQLKETYKKELDNILGNLLLIQYRNLVSNNDTDKIYTYIFYILNKINYLTKFEFFICTTEINKGSSLKKIISEIIELRKNSDIKYEIIKHVNSYSYITNFMKECNLISESDKIIVLTSKNKENIRLILGERWEETEI